jgi:hypothetical protein
MRISIVADNASARFGGESILPLHYFCLLRQRGSMSGWSRMIAFARSSRPCSPKNVTACASPRSRELHLADEDRPHP